MAHVFKYVSIYEEMLNRNIQLLKTTGNSYDSFWKWNDQKKCLAVVAKGRWKINTRNLTKVLGMLEVNFPDMFIRPILHHTFMVVRPWCHTGYSDMNNGDLRILLDDLSRSGAQKYSISFNKLIPVSTGLVMVGTPSHDINQWRCTFRELSKERDINLGELYNLDIAHSSLFRWVSPLTENQMLKFLNMVTKLNLEFNDFATFEVEGFDIVNASWLLEEPDVKVLAIMSLPGGAKTKTDL